jgi:hypothetical protein
VARPSPIFRIRMVSPVVMTPWRKSPFSATPFANCLIDIDRQRPQASSASRLSAGAFRFFDLIQAVRSLRRV